jgi:hypothetical protein
MFFKYFRKPKIRKYNFEGETGTRMEWTEDENFLLPHSTVHTLQEVTLLSFYSKIRLDY